MSTAQPPRPTKIIGVHLNYRSRAEQRGRTPQVPSYFMKPVSSISVDGAPLVRPRGTELLVFEGEIAVIIGKPTRGVTPERGAESIGWYAPANDVGLYDMRWADNGSNLLSKGHDGFTPIGTAVQAGEINGSALRLRTSVNGETVQEDTTEGLLFPFGLLIADLSRFMTLEPGDVILTGTPAGSRPLEIGDTVSVEIPGVAGLTNHVIEAAYETPRFGAQPRVAAATRAAALGSNSARSAILSPEAEAGLRRVSTATLTVQLTKHGIRNAFIRGVQPTRPGTRLLGYAFTLRYVPLREDVRDASIGLNAQKRAVESIGPGEVLVIDAREEGGAGTIGDILAARALARGATGIVTDGGLRDRRGVGDLEIPVYYKETHAAVLGQLHFPLETNVPVACGGALVLPGDVIVGDDDGVVVLPAALAEVIAKDAVEQESREAFALERVQAGESIRGIYPLNEEHQAAYREWRRQNGSGTDEPA